MHAVGEFVLAGCRRGGPGEHGVVEDAGDGARAEQEDCASAGIANGLCKGFGCAAAGGGTFQSDPLAGRAYARPVGTELGRCAFS